MNTFSDFLIYAMDKCGFDYRALAKHSGIKHQIIYRMIYNNQIPKMKEYIMLLNTIVEHSDLSKNFTNIRMIKILEQQIGGTNGTIKRTS